MHPTVANLALEAKEALRAALPSAVWRGLKRVAGTPQRRLTSFVELEIFLEEATRHFATSDGDGRRFVESVVFEPQGFSLPKDPESAAYRTAQLELYTRISGRPSYQLNHEFSQLDVSQALANPFPYSTGSAAMVGDQLMAQGFLLKALPFAAGARVVEFGPGWGHTTEQFLRLGCQVTAVEVDPDFCALLQRRLSAYEKLIVVQQDMLSFRPNESFDVAVFFESFHHCANPHQMLRQVYELLKPGAMAVFAAEPIADFVWPWGVRLDGLSLYSMRRYGWLELGFESSYFLGLLRQLGFKTSRVQAHSAAPLCDVVLATKP